MVEAELEALDSGDAGRSIEVYALKRQGNRSSSHQESHAQPLKKKKKSLNHTQEKKTGKILCTAHDYPNFFTVKYIKCKTFTHKSAMSCYKLQQLTTKTSANYDVYVLWLL